MTRTALAPAAPAAPPIPDELDAVLRRMRFPYLRKAAPEVLATARAQRWDPAEVVRILLEEEIRGRDEAGRRTRRKAAGLPAGKTFASWREADSSILPPAQHALATLEWVTRAENLCIAGPSVIHGTPTRSHQRLLRSTCSRSAIVAAVLSTGFQR